MFSGNYSHYSTKDGEFTDTSRLKTGEYLIIEISEEQLEASNEPVESECPELETLPGSELEQFCLYREEDGYCTTLGETCVLLEPDD
ncbi:hypothetical protein GL213_03480 [Halogeometricum borinquense]|uniref:Uncharacterized protein n=2 Tax=Halogeometricum borinquense TaxID=60847 RepID=E4NN66_HALBP|nr:hypothetical protein Hbor_06980 [Halogeometricum borinquense DSM 11551]ELY27715.1 hypothetical protein C499_09097 [Halogeometricum borinquense DSM 11551]QIQ77704.1 hypothetical protein GL213_03480 [Halogeometricum borinquense]